MAIVGTFNGLTIVATPLVTAPGGPGPRSIEDTATNLVGSSTGVYTGQRQTFNWRSGWAARTVTFPPLTRAQADPWIAFMKDCEGTVNAFQLPNPLATMPKGTVDHASQPVVDGTVSGGNLPQGQLLATRGWKVGQFRLLLPNDAIQIGYRTYSVLDAVNADGTGKATLRLWPRLRETPADGTAVKVGNVQTLYKMAGNTAKWSLNENRLYSLSFSVVEALPV